MRHVLCILGTLLLWVGGGVFVTAFALASTLGIVPVHWGFGGYVLMFSACLCLASIPWTGCFLITQRYCD